MSIEIIIIIGLVILLIGAIIGTYFYAKNKYINDALVYSLDVSAVGNPDTPNTALSSILNVSSAEVPLDNTTMTNNGVQVLTLTKDMYVGQFGLDIDKLYINNPNSYFIRGSNYCA